MGKLTTAAIAGRIVPGRPIAGMAAVLMPFTHQGQPDFAGVERQLGRIAAAGLTPAVNMDTGYVQRLSPDDRAQVLLLAGRTGGPFVAGAYVEQGPGALASRYARQVDDVQAAGGRPILFPCPELRALTPARVVDLFRQVTAGRRDVLLFELGEMFVPYGRIYDLPTFCELLALPDVSGLKHSSLDRQAEWDRLAARDRLRPDFRLYTGNDLAIDMVMYGSDYLLGLAAFFPEAFAVRDQLWAAQDPRFHQLNDLLQYLGQFAFRPPVPAYRHDAAMFLALRGIIDCDRPPVDAALRPDSDRPVLADILARLQAALKS